MYASVVISGQRLLIRDSPLLPGVFLCMKRYCFSTCKCDFWSYSFYRQIFDKCLLKLGPFFYDNLKKNREGKLSLAVSYGLQKYFLHWLFKAFGTTTSLRLITRIWTPQTENQIAPSILFFCFLLSTFSFGESWYAKYKSSLIVVMYGISFYHVLNNISSMACFLSVCSDTKSNKIWSLVKVLILEIGLIFQTKK